MWMNIWVCLELALQLVEDDMSRFVNGHSLGYPGILSCCKKPHVPSLSIDIPLLCLVIHPLVQAWISISLGKFRHLGKCMKMLDTQSMTLHNDDVGIHVVFLCLATWGTQDVTVGLPLSKMSSLRQMTTWGNPRPGNWNHWFMSSFNVPKLSSSSSCCCCCCCCG